MHEYRPRLVKSGLFSSGILTHETRGARGDRHTFHVQKRRSGGAAGVSVG